MLATNTALVCAAFGNEETCKLMSSTKVFDEFNLSLDLVLWLRINQLELTAKYEIRL